MVSVTADDLTNLLNLSSVSKTVLEVIIDAAIDRLNLRAGTSMSNMTGTAGSKTVTLTEKQRGAVLEVASAIYSISKSSGSSSNSFGLGGLSISETSAQGSSVINDVVDKCATYLRGRTFLRT